MTSDPDLSLVQLAKRADVTPRTIRYYIAQGLLPGPLVQGPNAHYTVAHLDRLRLIRRLQLEHLPLAEIRARLEALDDDQIAELAHQVDTAAAAFDLFPGQEPGARALDYIRSLLAKPEGDASRSPRLLPPAAAAAPPAPTGEAVQPAFFAIPVAKPPPPATSQPDRSTWERIALSPDIEIHVRRPLDRTSIRQLDQLLAAARAIFKREK